MAKIICNFTYCIYDASLTDPENGFSVCEYRLKEGDIYPGKVDKGDKFTAVGYFLSQMKDAIVTLEGEWVIDKKNGLQFKVSSCTEEIEKTKNSIISFLASPLIKGIGINKATKIYDKFGNDTIDIIENEPERLTEVFGISKRVAKKVATSYQEVADSRRLITFLGQYGISPTTASKIGKKLKCSLEDVKDNPYLIIGYKGISFSTIDKIAVDLNYDLHSQNRIKAGVKSVIALNEARGHLGISKSTLVNDSKKVLNKISGSNISENEIVSAVIVLINEEYIIAVRGNIYKRTSYDWESEIAKAIIRLMKNKAEEIPKLDEKIKEWENENNVIFDDIQKSAIKEALNQGFLVITGGPGRGKTTVSKCIVDIRKKYGKIGTITLLAPTGRASSRLSEATNSDSSTIHSFLQIQGGEEIGQDELDVFSEVDTEQLLCDETSMLDNWLCYSLLTNTKDGCNTTFVGDPDQLPSVGPGAILKDIIASGIVPVVKLEKIYRQAEGSTIIANAEKIRIGRKDIEFNSNDFKGYPADNAELSAKTMIYLYKEAVKKYGIDNVMLLSPFHHAKSKCSVDMMNKYLQEVLNPKGASKHYDYKNGSFREQDQIMQIKNADGISNGDIGRISKIFEDDGEISVEVTYPGAKTQTYDKQALDMLELAYAMSIHKAQGSEAPCVILNLLDEHNCMLKRNLAYTAITRASKELIFVGQISALHKAIDTIDSDNRITLLSDKLKQLFLKEMANENPFLKSETA